MWAVGAVGAVGAGIRPSGPEMWQREVGAEEWARWGPERSPSNVAGSLGGRLGGDGGALKRGLVGEGELGQVPGPKKEWGYVNYETISIS